MKNLIERKDSMEKNIENTSQDGSKMGLGREHLSLNMEVAPSLDSSQTQTSSPPNNGNDGNNGTSSAQNDSNDSEE